jgi:energy-coupling factor transporter ATP-binding protein EcfA2
MFLQSIKIENLRCFEAVEAEFGQAEGETRKWTVLLGENGAGKSTFLKAIALLTAGSDALSWMLPDPSSWVRNGAASARLSGTIATKDGRPREVKLVIEAGDGTADVIRRNASGLAALDNALAHSERNYFVAGYGSSRRLGSSSSGLGMVSQGRSIPPRAQPVATMFDPSHELIPFESWAMSIDYRRKDDGMDIIRDVLDRFTPGMRFVGIDRNRGALLFDAGEGPVPLSQLSDGFQNVVGWVGDLLFRIMQTFDDFENPLSARGLLLIDEVDLHLHPTWQKRLVEMLTTHLPQMQLVVTTHSAITAQQAGEDALFYFSQEDDGIHLRDFRGSPGRLRINQLLMSEAFGLKSDEGPSMSMLPRPATGPWRTRANSQPRTLPKREPLFKNSDQALTA